MTCPESDPASEGVDPVVLCSCASGPHHPRHLVEKMVAGRSLSIALPHSVVVGLDRGREDHQTMLVENRLESRIEKEEQPFVRHCGYTARVGRQGTPHATQKVYPCQLTAD